MIEALAVPPTSNAAPAEEEALISAARGSDRAAFGHLHDRYARMIHGIALAYLPHADAQDLVQDVFVAALERIASLKATAAFGGWLAAITRNRAMDLIRQRRIAVQLPPQIAATDRQHAAALNALEAIRRLPEAYRETLILRLVEGLTGPEIAQQTGLTPGSVRVNLHRGMKLLREELERGAPCQPWETQNERYPVSVGWHRPRRY